MPRTSPRWRRRWRPVRACLVKGRASYLCLRKLDTALAEDIFRTSLPPSSAGRRPPSPATGPRCLSTFARGVGAGVRGAGSPRPALLYYAQCFFFAAKEHESAQVLVTNHHLLFADAAIRQQMGQRAAKGVPKYRAVVLDEATTADDGRRYFTACGVAPWRVRLLSQVFRKESRPAARERAGQAGQAEERWRARAYLPPLGDRARGVAEGGGESWIWRPYPQPSDAGFCGSFPSWTVLSRPASEAESGPTQQAGTSAGQDRPQADRERRMERRYAQPTRVRAALEDLAESIPAGQGAEASDDDAGCTEADGLGHAADGSGDADRPTLRRRPAHGLRLLGQGRRVG